MQLYFHQFGLRFRARTEAGFDVWRLVEHAARLGFSGVNFWVMPPEFPQLRGGGAAALADLRAQAAALGMGLDVETRGTAPEHLRQVIAVAAQLGAEHLRTYTVRRDDPREQVEGAVRDLQGVADEAAAAGVTLLVENHEDLCGVETAEIVARVDHPAVRVLYDYGNSMVYFEEPAVSLARLASYARTAHLKDHVAVPAGVEGRTEPRWLGVPLGQGNLPIIETTLRLRKAGMRRVVFENCWAYDTVFRDRRGEGRLGEGGWAFRSPPHDPRVCLPAAEEVSARDGLDLVALERETGMASMQWLARSFAAAGIGLQRDLCPENWSG
jgi:3-oxoisoapionate decarboxylase